MVEYEYRDLFYNHSSVDLIVIQKGASLSWNSVTEQFDSEDSAFIIRNDDIDSESFELDEKLCSESNLKFGLCQAAHLTFTIYNKTTIPNLKDEMINVFLCFNKDPNTIFPVGTYLVDEDAYEAGRAQRTISAYDLLYELRDLDITDWYNQYFDSTPSPVMGWTIMNLFAWINGTSPYASDETSPRIDIEIDNTYILCNGDFVVNKTIESDTITFSFFMQGLLEFNGAFGHINRNGKLEFKTMESYTATPVRIVNDNHRFPPTTYDDINTWGIGGIDVYDRTNIRKFKYRNTDKKYPSIYVMTDPWVLADRTKGDTVVKNAIKKMHEAIKHQNYNPSETECLGDLCVEVGDRIDVVFEQPEEYDTRNQFRSYVLERHFAGLQGMVDTYTAKGNKKQPKYKIKNSNWHNGDSTDSSTQGEGGVSSIDAEEDRKLIAKQRNYGEPMLDEPTDVEVVYNKSSQQVEIKWTDPDDIDTYTPLPIEWEGTVVVRKEGSPPLHPFGNIDEYGGTVIETETTKNTYQSTAFVDDTIEPNKKYYYAIMPYFVKLDDQDHPVYQYRWTKCMSVDTERILTAPTIYPIQDIQISGTTVTVAYTIPTLTEGSYTLKKLVVKKNSIPTSKTDGDKIIDLTPDPTMLINGVEVSGLDENSHYFFVIFIEDEIGSGASSEPMDCVTGEFVYSTLGELAKTISLENTPKATGMNNIDDLSQYYLTDTILYAIELSGCENIMTFFDGDEGGAYGKNGRYSSYQGNGYKYSSTGFVAYIPISRVSISKIELKLKFDAFCAGGNDDRQKEWNFCRFRLGRIENGVMVHSDWVITTTYMQVKNTLESYLELSGELDNPFAADYFVILGYDGAYHFKDVTLYGYIN